MLPAGALVPPKQDLGVAYDSAIAFDTSTHDKVVSGLPRKRPARIEPHKLTREPAQPQCSNPLTARSTSASTTTPQTADFTALALALALCSCLCGTKDSCTCLTLPVFVTQTSRPAARNSTARSRAHHRHNNESRVPRAKLKSEAPRGRSKHACRHAWRSAPVSALRFCFTHLKRASQIHHTCRTFAPRERHSTGPKGLHHACVSRFTLDMGGRRKSVSGLTTHPRGGLHRLP